MHAVLDEVVILFEAESTAESVMQLYHTAIFVVRVGNTISKTAATTSSPRVSAEIAAAAAHRRVDRLLLFGEHSSVAGRWVWLPRIAACFAEELPRMRDYFQSSGGSLSITPTLSPIRSPAHTLELHEQSIDRALEVGYLGLQLAADGTAVVCPDDCRRCADGADGGC